MIDDRMLASTAGRFCTAGATITHVSLGLAMLALVVLAFGGSASPRAWGWGLVAALGIPGAWYRFRLAFDAGVFADVAARDEGAVAARLAAFDAALDVLSGHPRKVVATGALPERVRGARRLVVRAASVTLAQALVALLAALAP
jgi:hypothetical protein